MGCRNTLGSSVIALPGFKWMNLGNGKCPQKDDGDIGWDLFVVPDNNFHEVYSGDLGNRDSKICFELEAGARYTFSTDIAIELPENHHAILKPRSGLAVKKGIQVLAGVIDHSYSGEVLVCLYNSGKETVRINEGDRICQIIIIQESLGTFTEVSALSDTSRGDKGFGSSGK